MQSYNKCKVLLPRADKQGFTIDDVIPDDHTLEAVLDLDTLLENDVLKGKDVYGVLVLTKYGVRLAASGPSRGFKVTRIRKSEFKDSLDSSACKSSKPSRVKHVINLGSVTIVEGSDCTCTHGGAVVNICK